MGAWLGSETGRSEGPTGAPQVSEARRGLKLAVPLVSAVTVWRATVWRGGRRCSGRSKARRRGGRGDAGHSRPWTRVSSAGVSEGLSTPKPALPAAQPLLYSALTHSKLPETLKSVTERLSFAGPGLSAGCGASAPPACKAGSSWGAGSGYEALRLKRERALSFLTVSNHFSSEHKRAEARRPEDEA